MKPRLLDLFCGAGGCTKGYQRAGFYVVGIDLKPQPNYCGDEFIQDDALGRLEAMIEAWQTFGESPFAAIHASPPCQAKTTLRHLHPDRDYPDLIAPTRELLRRSGLPYVIENVVGADLISPVRLCGSSFGLDVWRHRLFEIHPAAPLMVPPCSHADHPRPIDVTGTGGQQVKPRESGGGRSRKPRNLAEAQEAMGIDWMTRRELSQAIPPAMTEWIGGYLLAELSNREALAA